MAGFHDIIGHEKIKEHLQKAIGYQRVSHAYILSGEEGMGRKTIAKAFAMTLLCEKHGTEPCMECHSCKQFLSGNHPDVIWVTHEKPGALVSMMSGFRSMIRFRSARTAVHISISGR